MKFEVECPTCNHVINVPASLVGGNTTCLRCGSRFLVPEADEANVTFEPFPAPELNTTEAGPSQTTQVDAESTEVEFAPYLPEFDERTANPFASPRFGGYRSTEQPPQTAAPVVRAIDIDKDQQPAFSLSPKELADVVAHTETTRKFVLFFFWLLVVVIVLQIISIVIAAIAMTKSATSAETGEAAGTLISSVIVALIYGFVAALMQDYAEHLGTFVSSRKPADLVEAMRSGGSYWKTTALGTAGVLVLAIVAIVVVVLILVAQQPSAPRHNPANRPPFRLP